MRGDKYSALWVSHSSIGDFQKCPRAYFLHNVYKDPQSGNKLTLMTPPLALGQTVHDVIESLSVLPVEKRFIEPLVSKFEQAWKKVEGKKGGFPSILVENQYKERGRAMLKRVLDHPGPLKNLAVKINMDLPYFWLSEEDNIILCGRIDWLEYFQDSDQVHIIDFKTGKSEEDARSLQLPIYHLLVRNCQPRKVQKVSFWYLNRNNSPSEQPLPNLNKSQEKILAIAKKIKLARQLNRLTCTHQNGCRSCRPYEAILRGEAEYVGINDFRQDVYVNLDTESSEEKRGSVIL